MRVWIRIGLVALIVFLGVRAWVLPLLDDPAAPTADDAPAVEATDAPAATAAAVLAEALGSTEAQASGPLAWRVTRLNWADGVLVLDVETTNPANARAIAERIVEPLDDSYEEVLIYVRAPAEADDPILHRVRWTPDDGYVETDFSER